MPKVSIIIPFNNVETYIRECLVSVTGQTLQDIEIICVNDASTDSSRTIVEEFAKNDKRIKVIDIPQRMGQGFARNRAIEIAEGEYIGFVDSDDKVEIDMFEELYNKAKENNNDITICQAREYDDINDKYILSDYYSLSLLKRMGDSVFSAQDTKDELLNINVVLWNKIYKREYLQRIGEKFPEGFIYEDLPFFFGTYLPAERIQIVWKNLYIYRINRKNSTMQQFNNKILDRLPMVSLTYDKMKKFSYLDDIRKRIQGWIINDLFHRYTLLKENFQREYFFLMKKIFENLEIADIDDDYWKSVYHFEGYLLVINNNFEDFNQKIFTDYIDVHKVENRILSLVYDKEDIDKKMSDIYCDIHKTYKYSDDKLDELNQKADTEYKNIYEEIAFNYDKTSEIFSTEIKKFKSEIDKIKSEIDENNVNIAGRFADLYNEINNCFDKADALTKEKISAVYSKINSEVSNIYTKSAQDCEELSNLIEKSAYNAAENIKRENEKSKNEVHELISELRNEIHFQSEKRVNNINLKIQEERTKLENDIKTKIDLMQSLFEEKLNNQKNEYENKINELNLKIDYLTKNPLKRYIEKIKKKNN